MLSGICQRIKCHFKLLVLPVLIDVCMGFHVRIEHRLVDTCVVAFRTLERFRAKVIAQMVLQVMLVFRDKRTSWALQKLVFFDVRA